MTCRECKEGDGIKRLRNTVLKRRLVVQNLKMA